MLSLGIDTSNYATSLAVVDTSRKEVVCAGKRFLPVKSGEMGLRQSDAVFHHTQSLPMLFEELKNQCDFTEIKTVGVSAKPRDKEGSYMPCFLAGVSFATAFAGALGTKPVLTTHQQGHLASAILGSGEDALQNRDILFFHLSGGTTEWMITRGFDVVSTVGGTLDLYAGQAVDRLGVQLGFNFPAGQDVSKLAETCNEDISPKVTVKGYDCHLSGLQNQYESLLKKGYDPSYVAKYSLIFLAKTMSQVISNVRRTHGEMPVLCAGGVMASSVIRRYLSQCCNDIYFAPPAYSADNAMGVALIAALAL